MHALKRHLGLMFAISGILCLVVGATLTVSSNAAAHFDQALLVHPSPVHTVQVEPTVTASPSIGPPAQSSEPRNPPTIPVAAPARSSTVVAPPADDSPANPVALEIDSIGLRTKVIPTRVIDGAWQVADFAAGYMEGTGLPGKPGNLAISGHDDIRGEVFRHLKSVKMGDAVTVSSPSRSYRYVVDGIRYVSPYDTSIIDPTPDPRLTLITCWPDFFTPKAAYNSLRLIVQARLAA